MNYKLRLNQDPQFEAEVKHYEEVSDKEVVIINDFAKFTSPNSDICVNKIELIGDDGEIYAMRKLPPHLTMVFSPDTELEICFKLTIQRTLIK